MDKLIHPVFGSISITVLAKIVWPFNKMKYRKHN